MLVKAAIAHKFLLLNLPLRSALPHPGFADAKPPLSDASDNLGYLENLTSISLFL
jgi:hypothetical protein